MKTLKQLNNSLLKASVAGKIEDILDLISKGANVNIKDSFECTPLHLASDNEHTGVALALISKGADCNTKDHGGDTPLHVSSLYGQTEVALALILHGADVHAKNNYAKTPLSLASSTFKKETALALISHGAYASQVHESLGHLSVLTMHQAAAQGGFTSRMIELLSDHPSSLSQDAPEALAALAKGNGKHETAASIQSFIASQAIEKMMNESELKPKKPLLV